MRSVKLWLILSEIWTMTDPRDLRRVVHLAVEAERAGVHGVMIGEHVVLGPNAASAGTPTNPRDWIKRGNQDPRYPHPSGTHLLAAIASATTTLRLLSGALLTPLRHPLIVAKELATLDLLSEGRLVAMPTVSWQREEYEALGVPFEARGAILDEQLEIWDRLWTLGSPVSADGEHFRFPPVFIEPQPHRVGGPELWIGGLTFAPWAVRRVVRYGRGYFPIVPPTDDQLAVLGDALAAGGRALADLELGAFLFGPPFSDATGLLDLDEALAPAPALVDRGFTTLVLKPSQYIDDSAELGDLCRSALRRLDALLDHPGEIDGRMA